jgi:lysyl endopeptidase
MKNLLHCLALLLLYPCAATAESGGTPVISAPPFEMRPGAISRPTSTVVMSSANAPARRIELDAPANWEAAAFKDRNAVGTSRGGRIAIKALAVGFGRELPAEVRAIPLSALAWTDAGGGALSARIEIRSPNAAALRIALQMTASDPKLTVAFFGSGLGGRGFGPVPTEVIVEDSARFGQFWSPVLEGEVATIELHAAPGAVLGGLSLTLPRLSHQVASNAELRSLSAKTLDEIGQAQSCNIDVACVPPSRALANAAKSVAQLLFVGDDSGNQYLCTGTLLSDSEGSNTPYVFTAGHCMTSATAAHTLNTFWFFDAIACRNNAVPPYVQLTGGALLLGRGDDQDWALVQLLELPPPGAWYSAWSAVPIAPGTVTTTLHHPLGDLKKWTQGTVTKSVFNSDSVVHGTFNEVAYSLGITEPGSSGSALLTYDDTDQYVVRGGLSEGNFVSCPVAPGDAFDDYSRMEDVLPLVRQYLQYGIPNPRGLVAAAEYYNKSTDHYFLTASQREMGDLDAGVHAGWERTGLRFLVYSRPSKGANPVCRIYRKPAFGDSHFYSASPAECAAAANYSEDWIFESPAVFYIPLPDPATGACPEGTRPLWRFFNHYTINHRYTAEVGVRDQLRAKPAVWIPEGYGPDATIMCSPTR